MVFYSGCEGTGIWYDGIGDRGTLGEGDEKKQQCLLGGTKGIVDQCLACEMVCNEIMISHSLLHRSQS